MKQKTMFPNNPNIANRTIDYSYHIQGMLQKTQSPLFTETLIYGANCRDAMHCVSTASLSNFTASYNGNISAKITRAIPDAGGGTHTIPMRDNYRYDKLDRLIADYHSGNGNQNFSVTGINYDLQGNILSLTRHGIEETQPGGGHGFEIVNQLAVVARGVESNKTRSEVVSNDADLWASYGSQNYIPNGNFEDNLYDFNGNLLFDDMRETEFKYNHLNLATKITNPSDTMLIQYDALGNKIRQISSGDTLYFVGGSIYKNSQLYYLPLPEGYYRDGKYYAVIHDYLGSVRIVLRANDNKIQEVNHYDPFGIEYGLSYHPFGVQPFKHQGKERMNITGFSLHNHGARLADNVMGRWTTRDPLEEKDYWNGAYVYCGNNPVRYIDPSGMIIEDPDKIVKKQKEHLATTLNAIQGMISDGVIGGATADKLVSFLTNSISEISTLESSEQVYNVSSVKTEKESGTSYDFSTNKVMVGVIDNHVGLVGHELKHAIQYENNEISFKRDGNHGSLYDIGDEVSAYNTERALMSGISFFETPNALWQGSPYQWSAQNVRQLGRSNFEKDPYKGLKSLPTNTQSALLITLKWKAFRAGQSGSSVDEVFKGWQSWRDAGKVLK